jgi:hypothetical protein
MKRILVREKQGSKGIERVNSLKKRFREGGRTEVDLKALREVQDQFDALIQDMTSAKLLLAGLAIGANEISYNGDVEEVMD